MANNITATILYIIISVYLIRNVIFSEEISFQVIRQWKYINYTWPTYEAYETAIKTSSYIRENVIIAGVIVFGDWIYLTMPRMKSGVPATLGRIPADALDNTAPNLRPYPSWAFNKFGDCNVLQNVQNIEITPNGEIWIVDGGHTNSLSAAPNKDCEAKLIIFDISRNESVLRYVFPEEVVSKNTNFLYNLVVDVENNFAYITDNSGQDPGIIVFSRKQNESWKIRHPTMKADTSAQEFRVDGIPISTPINIAGIALGPIYNKGDDTQPKEREVFYSPLSSLHLYSINASALQNKNNANAGLNYTGEVRDVGVKKSQGGEMTMSNKGNLYYGLLGDNSIARWNSQTPFATNQTIICRDFQYIHWTNSFTIDSRGRLIVLTNMLHKFIYKDLGVNETNFWLISANIDEDNYLFGDNYNHSIGNGSMSGVLEAYRNYCNTGVQNVIIVMLLTALCFSYDHYTTMH